MAKNELCESIAIFLSCSLAVLLPTLSSFLHGIVERDKFSFQRVVCKQRSWQWIGPQNVTFFCGCNSHRIGQNIQNEVSPERSIFADVVAYQFINLNGKANRSRKEDMHRSIWNENDQGSRRRVKLLIVVIRNFATMVT